MLRLSHLKIGGSPLYYTKGQEHKLQDYSDKLHEKEKKAYELLKEKKVIRDDKLDPVTRVALRQIKDFAVPLNININNSTNIYWKWYLISNEEALELIKSDLNLPKEEKKIKKPTKQSPKFVDNTKSLHTEIQSYFSKNNIEILKELNIKRNDYELIVGVPTSVGKVEFLCKAKNKKLINDKDLASALVAGQASNKPVLYLSKGKLTKKATEMINKEFKGLKFIQI
jgi:hypothetical protein